MKAVGISGPSPQHQLIRPAPRRPQAAGFARLLEKAIDQVNDKQLKADQALKDFALGKIENVHDLMLAEVEADTSFRMLAQARNKLVEAYKEIMRMQI